MSIVFKADYNPMTSFRDSDIEHCAIYRMEQKQEASKTSDTEPEENKNSSRDGE